MQLYALEGTSPISASRAEKAKNYLCPECRALLRLRSGPHRQLHFYHLTQTPHCRQHQKSAEHLHIQLQLLSLLTEEAKMECVFSSIGRIADVAWHTRKIIFEIQFSPISLEEVQNRNNDYRQIGYEVIWILHEKQFNKNALCSAEHFLRTTSCYFTNIDRTGRGIIYDQFEVFKGHRRLFKGPALKVEISKLARLPNTSLELPSLLQKRRSQGSWYSQGDLLDRLLKDSHPHFSAQKLRDLESQLLTEKKEKRLPWFTLLFLCYKKCLEWILKNL